ncbi:MAG TPA: hypothetical protein VG944_22755 [Fimbriimonas sp.]|nr:hypothetical protein [Fimbriimonas sp.]
MKLWICAALALGTAGAAMAQRGHSHGSYHGGYHGGYRGHSYHGGGGISFGLGFYDYPAYSYPVYDRYYYDDYPYDYYAEPYYRPGISFELGFGGHHYYRRPVRVYRRSGRGYWRHRG